MAVRRNGSRRVTLAVRVVLVLGGVFALAGVLQARASEDLGGTARELGMLGLTLLALAAGQHAVTLYQAGVRASLPRGVAGTRFGSGAALHARMTLALVFAVGLPVAAATALVVLVEAGWAFVTLALVIALAGLVLERRARPRAGEQLAPPPDVRVALERLCMQADMPVPPLVVDPQGVATAWTSHGHIHLTWSLIELLDARELEAVLAHELAHLAHRDAAVMDVATAPSRALLGGATVCVYPEQVGITGFRARIGLALFGLVYLPPALLFGWTSRLGVLGLSRARELHADAAAASVTGRPSALASALVKLDQPRSGVPRVDLRAIDAHGALSIVEIDPSRRGRLFHTHPPVATRVERLHELEARLQRA